VKFSSLQRPDANGGIDKVTLTFFEAQCDGDSAKEKSVSNGHNGLSQDSRCSITNSSSHKLGVGQYCEAMLAATRGFDNSPSNNSDAEN
jgi:hypothetical protein